MHEKSNVIDVIVTWVDGRDPYHIERKNASLERHHRWNLKYTASGKSAVRFTDNNEIEYCLRGIRKFMPWVNNIFLVTDSQCPRFLTADVRSQLGIQIIDHRQIFDGYEEFLPTFNSRSIETALYRVPGLASQYIYFNDDFIPVAPAIPEDFFTAEGVVVRGQWLDQNIPRLPTAVLAFALRVTALFSSKDRSAHLLAQMKSARLAGFKNRYYKALHAPHPVRTETLIKFFHDHPNIFKKNIKYQFRNMNQFVGHPLAHHLEASADRLVQHDGHDCVTFSFGKEINENAVLQSLAEKNIKFICLQSLELASDNLKNSIIEFLDHKIMSAEFSPS